MSRLTIAALQPTVGAGNNLNTLCAELRRAKARFPWVELLLLPELTLLGPDPALAEPAGGATERHLADLARDLAVWLVPGSLYEQLADGTVRNCSPVFNPAGEVVGRHYKLAPFEPYEQGISQGTEPLVFDMPGVGRVGLLICYDLWVPEAMRALAWQGAEVVLVPTLTNTVDRDVEQAMVRAQAAWNQCYVVDLNVAAPLGNGGSIVCGPGGEVVHQAGDHRELITLDLDLAAVRHCREYGWHGLGQPLKSFRDLKARTHFPQYSDAPAPAMAALGPLQPSKRPPRPA